MRRPHALLLAAAVAGGCATGEPATAEAREGPLAAVAWLTGSWTTGEGANRFEEVWLAPAGSVMVGVGRAVRNDATRSFEYLRIEARGDGIFYVAAPGGGPATEFRLVDSGPDHVRFENPEHDFPTAISYQRTSDGRVTARVEGEQDGAATGFELRFHTRQL